ncbi:MAG: cob(I)yrinic acid a,c-diamide adenosyltransferase [Chloroflexi bacterium]|nr:cob(I)yrinic acid a,c-diamide adenosyltransferase [Chloroflexota bacterium]MYF79955.1 cob(I)yrinic acid a,c-diamide adenosyltransferase [Chloroflexota bacterium]
MSLGTHDITPPLVRNSISTKVGDSGETSLLYGGRVSKSNRRVEANGIGDEAVSLLGLARAHCDSGFLHDELLEIQRLMFIANAELTTEISQLDSLRRHFLTIGDEQIDQLDGLLKKLEEEIELPPSFIIPGASVASATLDVARCKVRELERAAVTLYEDDMLENKSLLVWLNRLSDCLFMMARYADRELPPEMVTGTRRTS